jgi:hypothetical protein
VRVSTSPTISMELDFMKVSASNHSSLLVLSLQPLIFCRYMRMEPYCFGTSSSPKWRWPEVGCVVVKVSSMLVCCNVWLGVKVVVDSVWRDYVVAVVVCVDDRMLIKRSHHQFGARCHLG